MFRRQRIRACPGQWPWGGGALACDSCSRRPAVSPATPSLCMLQRLLQESEALRGSFPPSAVNSQSPTCHPHLSSQ